MEKDFIETAFIDTDALTDELRQLKTDYHALQQAYQQLQATPTSN